MLLGSLLDIVLAEAANVGVRGLRNISRLLDGPLLKEGNETVRLIPCMTGLKLAVKIRPKYLFPRTGQFQASLGLRSSPATWPEPRTMGQQLFPDLPSKFPAPIPQ